MINKDPGELRSLRPLRPEEGIRAYRIAGGTYASWS